MGAKRELKKQINYELAKASSRENLFTISKTSTSVTFFYLLDKLVNAKVNSVTFVNLTPETKYQFSFKIGDSVVSKEVTTNGVEGLSEISDVEAKLIAWNKFEVTFKYHCGDIPAALHYSVDGFKTYGRISIPNDDVSGAKKALVFEKKFKTKVQIRAAAKFDSKKISDRIEEIYFVHPQVTKGISKFNKHLIDIN